MLTCFVILMAYIAFDLSVKSGLKEEIENLHNDMDLLLQSQREQENNMKDMKKGFLFFKDELLGDTLKEIHRLLNQVTKMDEEIGKLGENYKAVSDQLKRLQNGRYGWC